MMRLIIIALGGAIGTLLRYCVGGLDYRFSQGVFPVSTFIVNLTGSLIIGFLWGFFERFAVAPNIRLFILIGILGGYTTFSTFSLETFHLLRDCEYKIALMNVLLSNVLGVAAVFAGYFIAKILLHLCK
ncbi:MAG: fluoride efflux transporter CrcB [Candidatus Omnitrophica bacterium]|nr:fluoride efflux transporter CrcB [Candidatus Omnitrophota bacterium]